MSYAATEWGSPASILLDTTCRKCKKPVTDIHIRSTKSGIISSVIFYRCNTMQSKYVYCGDTGVLCPFCGQTFSAKPGNLRKHIERHFPQSALQNSSISRMTGFNECSFCPFSLQNMDLLARYQHVLNHFESAIRGLQREPCHDVAIHADSIQRYQVSEVDIVDSENLEQAAIPLSHNSSFDDLSFTATSDSEFDISDFDDIDHIDLSVEWNKRPSNIRIARCTTHTSPRIDRTVVHSRQLNLRILGPAPVQSEDMLGLHSPQAFKVIIDWWLMRGISDTSIAEIIQSIRCGEMNVDKESNLIPLMPTSLRSFKERFIAHWKYMRPIRQSGTLERSAVYSVKDHLSRIFANLYHTQHMNFEYEDPPDGIMTEFYHTPGFRQLINSAPEDCLPVIIILNYDVFSMFQKKAGNTGGLYFTLMNFNREHISKVRSIFCLGSIDIEEDIMEVYKQVINELIELESGYMVQLAVQDNVTNQRILKWVKINVMLGLVIGDMPQRHVNASMMACTSEYGACFHCITRSADLLSETNLTKLRTTEIVLRWRDEWSAHSILSKRTNFNRLRGMKFTQDLSQERTAGHTPAMMNPFWHLSKSVKYDFCIHRNTMVDLFHVEILGLLRKHFDLLWTDGLEAAERRDIETAFDEISVHGISNRRLKDREFWNGDDWLSFFSVAPFALYDVLNRTPEGRQHWSCWMAHTEYLTILLSEGISADQIAHARHCCMIWRQQMEYLFDLDKLTIPNYHAILHVFDQTVIWGPPVLHWTRPFEHRHLLLRRQAQRSNMRDLHQWIVKRDMLLEHVCYMCPSIELQKSTRVMQQRSLKDSGPDSFIVCRHPHTSELRHAQVIRIHAYSNEVEVKFFKTDAMDPNLRCLIFSGEQEAGQFRIPRERILRRFIVTKGRVNRFCVLNTLRL